MKVHSTNVLAPIIRSQIKSIVIALHANISLRIEYLNGDLSRKVINFFLSD